MILGYGGLCQKKSSKDDTSSGSSTPNTPTAPAQVTSPTPANNAIDVITTTQLSWASVVSATSYDVYFGITTTGWTLVTNTINTTCNPGTLSSNTTYYWRVDSKNNTGTTTGNVWNFKTTLPYWIPQTPTGSSPSARNKHAMVWDGQQVIMFGGSDTYPAGGKDELWWYNPLSNTWTAITPTGNSPPGRTSPTMVWDGQRVIMFGGMSTDGADILNDLWYYYPVSNTWIQQFTSITPSARYVHAMVWDPEGQRAIMFGGSGGGNETWWYEPLSNTWINKSTTDISPTARSCHAMCWDPIGQRVIMFGGTSGSFNYKNDMWFYEPLSNTWTSITPTGSSPSVRYSHAMVWDGKQVIMFGGVAGPTHDYTKNDLWIYDPLSNTWAEQTSIGTPPEERGFHSMIWDGQKLIIFGGDSPSGYKSDLWWWK
jgi:hypothetical protein